MRKNRVQGRKEFNLIEQGLYAAERRQGSRSEAFKIVD